MKRCQREKKFVKEFAVVLFQMFASIFQEHKDIETIIKNLDKSKYNVPENFNYEEARRLFREPEVTPAEELDLKWEKPDEEGLVRILS